MSKVPCRVNENIHRFYLPDVSGQHVPGGTIIELSPEEAITQEKENTITILDRSEVDFYQLETAQKDVNLEKKNQEIKYLKAKLAKQEAANTAAAENALLKQELAEMKKMLNAKTESKESVKSVSDSTEKRPVKKVVKKKKSIIKKEDK